MSILEIITQETKDIRELFRKLNYITDCCATRNSLIYGSAVSIIDTYEEMMAVKSAFNQTDRTAFKHYVLSIEEYEEISLLSFKHLAIEVCEFISNFYGKFQVLMAVHLNEDNLHVHYIANTIDYLTGCRINLNMRRLEELKYFISKILRSYNISSIRMKHYYTADYATE